jgi:HEAT repeat protein
MAFVACSITGCSFRPDHALQNLSDLMHGSGDTPEHTAAASTDGAKISKNAAPAKLPTDPRLEVKDHDRDLLADRSWHRTPPTSPSMLISSGTAANAASTNANTNIDPRYHWQHNGLQEIANRERSPRAIFAKYAADPDTALAVTAAIGLARYYDPSDRTLPQQLIHAVNDTTLLTQQRCAAAEALGHLGSAQQGSQAVPTLLDKFGQFQRHSGIVYLGDLHAELLDALARRVDAADDPRFTMALESPAAVARISALNAWAASRRGTLPQTAVDLRSDLDPKVRMAAYTAMAVRGAPGAQESLAQALHDVDLDVRLTAVTALAQLGSGGAKAMLADLLKDHSELLRAATVSSLAQCGLRASVLGAAGDPSWRVRIKVAEALAEYADEEGAAAARKFLSDTSAAVQQQAVLSTAHWPAALAGTVLFAALEQNASTTRKTAADELSRRWPSLGRFPYTETPQRRAEAMAAMKAQFAAVAGSDTPQPPTVATSSPWPQVQPQVQPSQADPVRIDPAEVDQIVNRMAAGDWKSLAALGPRLIPCLEAAALDRQHTLPEEVYSQVLPAASTEFAALDRLHRGHLTGDVALRRSASEELAVGAKKQPLSRLAVARLAAIVSDERDALVWLNVFETLGHNGTETVMRLWPIALGQPAAEVRRRACMQMAAFPSAAHATYLLPLLDDTSRSVRLAAIDALGMAGRTEDIPALKKLLVINDPGEQLAVAVALFRLHDRSYAATLEQVSYSSDAKLRCQVADTIGSLADASQAGTLIRLLDDSSGNVRHAALENLPRSTGHDISRTDDTSAIAPDEQIRRWKEWFAGKKGK